MKTIEERAKEFAQNFEIIPKGDDCEDCDTCTKCNDYRRYVDIVTEQKAIDIDKACEWLKGVQCVVHPHIAYGFAEEFRRAMEDQLCPSYMAKGFAKRRRNRYDFQE